MPRVLITGAGGGLGGDLAALYASKGWEVQPLLRTKTAAGPYLEPWRCDLADPAAVAALCADRGRLAGFDLTLFAAGTSEAGPLEDLAPEAFRRCLEVNFLAPLALFRALASASLPCRRFVFVLSGASELLVPGLGPYALSKRALRDWLALTDLEQAFPGCRLLAAWPGPMATGFDQRTRIHGHYALPTRGHPRNPAEVARRILEAEEAGRRRLVLSRLPGLLGRLQALAPALAGSLIRWGLRGSPGPRASPGT